MRVKWLVCNRCGDVCIGLSLQRTFAGTARAPIHHVRHGQGFRWDDGGTGTAEFGWRTAPHTNAPDHHDTAIVYMNTQSEPHGDEGEIIFANGSVKWAAYQMPVVSSADELAQEIAGAVESVEKRRVMFRHSRDMARAVSIQT